VLDIRIIKRFHFGSVYILFRELYCEMNTQCTIKRKKL